MMLYVNSNDYYNYVLSDLAKKIPPFSYILLDSSANLEQKRIVFIHALREYLQEIQRDDHTREENKAITLNTITTIFDTMNQSLQKFFHGKIKLFISRYMGGLKKTFKGIQCNRYYTIYDPQISKFWYQPNYITDIMKRMATYLCEQKNTELRILNFYYSLVDFNNTVCDLCYRIYSILSRIMYDFFDITIDSKIFSNNVILYDMNERKFYRRHYRNIFFTTKKYLLHELISFFVNEDTRCNIINTKKDIYTIQVSLNDHTTIYDIVGLINYYTGLQLTVLCSSYPYVVPSTIPLKNYDEEEQYQ